MPVLVVLFLFSYFLKRTVLSVRTKKFIFGFFAILFLYPAIFPLVKFGLICPSIYVMLNLFFVSSYELNQLVRWNIEVMPWLSPLGILIIALIVNTTKNIFYKLDDES